MILVAYASLVVVLVWLFRDSTPRLSTRAELPARLLGMIGATATASIALLLISRNHASTLGLIMLLMLLLGSILFLCGFVLWHERVGFALRLSGWILLVAALAIPSTLTLLMPLAALLTLTLCSARDDQTLAARLARH